jgi:hypothetical protein
MNDYLQRMEDAAPFADLTGAEAAQTITASLHEPYDVVGFNTVEANRLGVEEGQRVAIAPDDTGGLPFSWFSGLRNACVCAWLCREESPDFGEIGGSE